MADQNNGKDGKGGDGNQSDIDEEPSRFGEEDEGPDISSGEDREPCSIRPGEGIDQCTCTDVDPSVLRRLVRPSDSAAAMNSDTDRVATLASVLTDKSNFDHLCWRHLCAITAHCGLRVHKGGKDRAREWLLVFWTRRDILRDMRIDALIFTWFKKKARPPAQNDSLRPYRFAPNNDFEVMSPIIAECRRLLTLVSGSPGMWDEWTEESSVNIKLFDWL